MSSNDMDSIRARARRSTPAVVLFVNAILVVLATLVADMLLLLIDPRIRLN